MQKIKTFKTTNNDMLSTQDAINEWIEKNSIEVHQITTVNGASYTKRNSSYVSEVEIFIVVLYTETIK